MMPRSWNVLCRNENAVTDDSRFAGGSLTLDRQPPFSHNKALGFAQRGCEFRNRSSPCRNLFEVQFSLGGLRMQR